MKPLATAAFCVALALLTFFQFPGHTWLQQDTQIYVPILEHLHDPSVLRNDILVQYPHVAFTLYDETALALRALSRTGFREVLAAQQIVTRALGIWGLVMMAGALGLGFGPAMLVAAICSLGTAIAGPAVLTFEYEPTPRAFAVPLLICAMGLAAQRRHLATGVAAAAAFLYHPPTALPFWGVYALLAVWPHSESGSQDRRAGMRALIPMAVSVAILLIAARAQAASGDAQNLFARLDSGQEFLQRLRATYVWVSLWPAATIVHHLLLLGIVAAAFARVRQAVPIELRALLLGLSAAAILSMPLSWLLLEQWKWSLAPQVQPMRALLFLALAMQFLTAAAGVRALVAPRPAEAFAWFVLAYLLPLQPVLTGPWEFRRVAVAVGLAALTALAGIRFAPAVAMAAFFAIPILGGVVNYPRLHTPVLAELAAWARANTGTNAVFVFPDVNHGLAPGIFRSQALRAVYVDWKGGGQVNYLKDLGEQWWFRWQETRNFQPGDLPRYGAIGVGYVVLQKPLEQPAVFQNSTYAVYRAR